MVRPSVDQDQKSPKLLQQSMENKEKKKNRNKKKEPIKVVYISNPMMVTTSAANFRDLVQRLTGRESNVAEFMAVPEHPSPPTLPDCAGVDADHMDDELSADSTVSRSGGAVRPADPLSDYWGKGARAVEETGFEVFDDDGGAEALLQPQMLENLPEALCNNYEALSRWILEAQW